ncbi:hypothetical protein INS49_002721 [Diaporthe citri]|uniref:uncharacterized protein n=1 Tax=Diaporthe citri TaxID=83186 RepID=UPI001C823416|nr:uncharacterized protein INS49_002721 [Diaporthe citri]KAG6368511.1 hypothetical protein INS49_002721 [Diaporthe citri]
MGRGKCRDAYLEHEKKHGELGHFTTLTDVPKPKEFIIRTDFADADATTTAAEGDESLTEDDTISGFEADDSPGKGEFHWVSGILTPFPLSRAVFAIDTIGEQQRSLSERNNKLLGEYPGFSIRSLAHLGLNCIGPCRVVDNIISRLCPSSATLSFETTALRRGEGGPYMRTRCISCQTEFDLSNALEKYDLKSSSHDQICENKRCTKPGFGGSRFCKDHLSALHGATQTLVKQTSRNFKNYESMSLRFCKSSGPTNLPWGKSLHSWTPLGPGKSPVSALRFVDLEYNIFTGRVFEIGMYDAYGTKTMDCRTLYGSKALRAIIQKSSTADCNMDRMMMKSVQAHHSTQGSKTAKQIADELRRQGISQETYFIVWHFHTDDLS